MRMSIGGVALLIAHELASHVSFGFASPSTVPAFIWSPHLQSSIGEMDEAVNYRVMSAKDLVDSVFTQGGWSNFLCSGNKLEQPVDVALVFIGRENLYTASNIVFSDSCFVEDGTIQKLSSVQSFKDHLVARKERLERKQIMKRNND